MKGEDWQKYTFYAETVPSMDHRRFIVVETMMVEQTKIIGKY